MTSLFAGVVGPHRDLSHEMRKLSSFGRRYREDMLARTRDLGLTAEIDEVRLGEVFLDWHEAFSRQRAFADLDRRDFIVFSAGLMLAHLLRGRPLRLGGPGASAANVVSDQRLAFWPEGFLQTGYCLALLEGVLEQKNEAPLRLDPCFDEMRTWWSFRENAAEDPFAAIGFFDRFTGTEPNWTSPGLAEARPAMRRAGPALTMH